MKRVLVISKPIEGYTVLPERMIGKIFNVVAEHDIGVWVDDGLGRDRWVFNEEFIEVEVLPQPE